MFSYQWLRDGAPIAGATSPVYTVLASDLGHSLVCEVTATNVAGRTSARSSAITVVVPVVTTATRKLKVAKNATKASIACANASCVGSAEVIERSIVKQRKGGKAKKVSVVLAKGSYSLAAGKTGKVTLRLTSVGKKRLVHRRRLSAKLVISVVGGKQIEKTVQLSA